MKEEKKISAGTLSVAIFTNLLIILISVFFLSEYTPAEQTNDSSGPASVQNNAKTEDKVDFSAGPHQKLTCDECHRMDSNSKPLAGEFSDPNSIRLCQKCHPEVITHPVGIEPTHVSSGTLNSTLPLGKDEVKGKIVCLTCHAIHLSADNRYLLRGPETTYRLKRTALCLNCHPDRFYDKSPHTQDDKSCGFCHVARPDKEKFQNSPPEEEMQASCSLCHVELPDAHYSASNPFIDADILVEAVKSGLISDNGQPACTSCHDYHGKADGAKLLEPEYLKLCNTSRSIDPHWNDLHCLSCHDRDPVTGDAPIRYGDDINTMCNHCHRSEYARSDIHPVGIKPSKHVRIPKEMPLQNDKLTCTTCHDPCMQVGEVRHHSEKEISQLNLFFLRGKEKSRTSFCFLCHLEETYKRLNPHEQVNAEGKILEETCLFCHASIPDVSVLGPEKVSFIVQNPDAYCIGCHHGFTRNHPAGIDHLMIPSDKISAALNTSIQRIGVELPLYHGRVVCATCHNPHSEGVIKFSEAATGTKRQNKLRLMPGRMQCVGCHWDKR